MKQIDISTPKHPKTFALVDNADFEGLNQWKWHIIEGCKGKKYVTRTKQLKGKKTCFYMHRVVMATSKGLETDHINHDALDNRRSNLRVCTKSQNQHNRRPHSGTSKYKGVAWNGSKWAVYIAANGQQHYLGIYTSEEEAAEVYRKATKKYHGEFANV